MKKVWDVVKDYVYIVVAVLIIRTFIVTPAIVSGASMDNTLADGQLVVVNKFIYRFSDIKRFDIVVVDNESSNDKIIKRVIGLPNETIKYVVENDMDGNLKGILLINGERVEEDFIPDEAKLNTCIIRYQNGNLISDNALCNEGITIPEGHYYVMGDNRGVSKDSRALGTFSKSDLVGRVKYRLYPFSKFGNINKKEDFE